MAGVWGIYRSMEYKSDDLHQVSATANHGTLYTVTDYSGKGILFNVGEYVNVAGGYQYCYIKVTVDGTATILDVDVTSNLCALIYANVDQKGALIPLGLEFNASLKVEIANDAGSAYNIAGQTHYGVF